MGVIKMLTDSQKQQRKLGIGGSDAAAICGLSKYKTPLQVYYEKTDATYEVEQNEKMYWGNAHEITVLKEYEKRTGRKVLITNVTKIHKDFEFIRGNLDGFIEQENAILECKTTEAYDLSEWGEPGTDEFPDEYILQCAHYSMITGADYVDVAVLIGLSDFRIYKYIKNKNVEDYLLDQEVSFWSNNVLKQIPPDPITIEDVKLRWKNHKADDYAIASQEIEFMFESLKILKETIKDFEGQKEAVEFQIKKFIQDSEGLKNDRGKVLATWKTQNISRLDINALKIKEPEIYKNYLMNGSSRVFLLKK